MNDDDPELPEPTYRDGDYLDSDEPGYIREDLWDRAAVTSIAQQRDELEAERDQITKRYDEVWAMLADVLQHFHFVPDRDLTLYEFENLQAEAEQVL